MGGTRFAQRCIIPKVCTPFQSLFLELILDQIELALQALTPPLPEAEANGMTNGTNGVAPLAQNHPNHRMIFDFAENVVTLFWCLSYVFSSRPIFTSHQGKFHSETSNKALRATNALLPTLLPFLVSFLSSENRTKLAIPIRTCVAAGGLLPPSTLARAC
jgi:hypothetical protein